MPCLSKFNKNIFDLVKRICAVAFVGMFSSCAGMLNSPLTSVRVRTSKPATVTMGGQSVKTIRNRVELVVPRQKKSLFLTVTADSLTKKVRIGYFNSAAFWLNIYAGYGLGMLVDKNNPKRYGYPPMIYVDMRDTTRKILSFGPKHKYEDAVLYDTLKYTDYSEPRKTGDLVLDISMPYANSFSFMPDGES